MRDFFQKDEHEVSFGDVMLGPALFQVDVARLFDDPVAAQIGNDKMEAMAEIKLLDFNMDKLCLIAMGRKKARTDLEEKNNCKPSSIIWPQYEAGQS